MDTKAQIIYKLMEDDYERINYGNFRVIIRKKDGYINATKLCKDGGKEFRQWKVNQASKLLLEEFEKEWKCQPLDLNIKEQNETRGTYVHPDLVVHIALWISPRFGLLVSRIVKEWNSSDANRALFWTEMGTCVQKYPYISNTEEDQWKRQIAAEENGQMEVKTALGFIDVLTPTKIIEIKEASNWKHALGQILAYSEAYPDHERHIYLFNGEEVDHATIGTVCARFQVQVTYLKN